MKKLPASFYLRSSVVGIARDLLGKVLVTDIGGLRTAGMITETEAYEGVSDCASHAYNHRRTRRTEVMYAEGGTAYVYLCYGIHHLFNVVTNKKEIPHAVLVRSVEPLEGLGVMLQRRNKIKPVRELTSGPGALSQALGIKTSDSGESLLANCIWIEDRGITVARKNIIAGTRIGVAYAGEDALLPYRFYIEGNQWVSKPRQ